MSKIFIYFLLLKYCAGIFNKSVIQNQCIERQNFVHNNVSKNDEITWDIFMHTAYLVSDKLEQLFHPSIIRILSSANVSESCSNSLSLYLQGVKNWEPWAIQMADATARIPSGLLVGTKTDFGSFDQCLEIRATEQELKGQFCMVGFQTPLVSSMKFKTDSGKSYLEAYGKPPDWILDVMLKQDQYLKTAGVWLGICMPSTCKEDDVNSFFTTAAKPWDFKVSISDCQTDEPKTWPPSSIISKYVLFVLVGICTLGTILDSKDNSLTEMNKLRKLLICFSIPSNFKKLFEIKDTDRTPFNCMNGVRFFIELLFIMEHAMFFNDRWRELKYTSFYSAIDVLNWRLLYLENGFLFVENFYMMSGILLAFSLLKQLTKNNRIDIVDFFVQKYFRLIPVFLFSLCLYFYMPNIGSGPVWNSTWEKEVERCEKSWWLNMLFIQNIMSFDTICFLHTWFLGCLMQTNIAALITFYTIYRKPKVGIPLAVALVAGCVFADYKTVKFYNYRMMVMTVANDYEIARHFVSNIYFRSSHHFPSVLIGMGLAVIWLKYKDKQLPEVFYKLGWILSIIISHLVMVALHLPNANSTTVALYYALKNIIFTLTFAWAVYACSTGHGGIFNKFMSADAFIPLGRLCYCIFMLHPLVILYRFASLRDRIHIGLFSHTYESCAILLITIFLSFIAFAAVEMPFINIYNGFLKRKQQPSGEKQNKAQNHLDEVSLQKSTPKDKKI